MVFWFCVKGCTYCLPGHRGTLCSLTGCSTIQLLGLFLDVSRSLPVIVYRFCRGGGRKYWILEPSHSLPPPVFGVKSSYCVGSMHFILRVRAQPQHSQKLHRSHGSKSSLPAPCSHCLTPGGFHRHAVGGFGRLGLWPRITETPRIVGMNIPRT